MNPSRFISKNHIFRQLSHFGLVGITATFVDLAVYNLAVHIGVITPISKALSFMFGLTVSYAGNSNLTFRKKEHKKSRFLATYGTSLLLNVSINEFFLNLVFHGWKYALISSWFVATGVSALFNFLTLKKWVFAS